MYQRDILAVVLGGGAGARLYPLTKERAKPAIPIGGQYRLVDIPISNCLNSDIDEIYVLTQFNSVSLHRHIAQTYKFDQFSRGWVHILAAEQTPRNRDWYQGTADAVRKQLPVLRASRPRDYLVLSSDHLYRMDYQAFVRAHRESGADITLGVVPTSRVNAFRFGIVKADTNQKITAYQEKPTTPEQLANLISFPGTDRPYLASMGIYVFRAEVLYHLLDNTAGADFATDLMPTIPDRYRFQAYRFNGYWEDIGTIRTYYEANLALANPDPMFNFYDPERPMYSLSHILPANHLDQESSLNRVLLSDGCRIVRSQIYESVIGLRSMIGPRCKLSRVIMLGAGYYESESEKSASIARGIPPIGIGRNCSIEVAIIDKNARIGDGVIIRDNPNRRDAETDYYVARDGIVVVPKNAIIPQGTVI
jgi:glucose-1-phosphate adenylyltransferase